MAEAWSDHSRHAEPCQNTSSHTPTPLHNFMMRCLIGTKTLPSICLLHHLQYTHTHIHTCTHINTHIPIYSYGRFSIFHHVFVYGTSFCKYNLLIFLLPTFYSSERYIFNKSFHKLNLLTRNVNYSSRTAPLTSKVAFYIFIQQI